MVSAADVKRATEATLNIAIPSDRRLLSVIPRHYILDGQAEVKDPVGMYGYRLDADAHLITASANSVHNLLTCVYDIGIDVEDLIPQAIASSEAVLTDEERELGIVLADIGCGTTDIIAFKQGKMWYSAALPVGGYQLTRDLSIGLGLPYKVAEEVKLKFGDVSPEYENDGTFTLGDNGYTISYQEVYKVIAPRVEEIFKLILAELSTQEGEVVVPAGLMLVGGTANLHGIEALGQGIMGFPVKVGLPRGVSGPADILYDPAYTASVGLLLWGARHAGNKWWKSQGSRQDSLIDMLKRAFSGRPSI
jgi:cell division protein FtsA